MLSAGGNPPEFTMVIQYYLLLYTDRGARLTVIVDGQTSLNAVCSDALRSPSTLTPCRIVMQNCTSGCWEAVGGSHIDAPSPQSSCPNTSCEPVDERQLQRFGLSHYLVPTVPTNNILYVLLLNFVYQS